MRNKTHLVIPDVQLKSGVSVRHLHALANLIKKRKPTVIVIIGDWFDMPSLSSYDKGKKKAEGTRYCKDIQAGNKGLHIINSAINSAKKRDKKYKPRLVFCIGNHEERIMRHIEANPELDGQIGYHDFDLDGWELYDYLELVEIDGIHYTNYLANPYTGKPIAGTIMNKLKHAGFSFTVGHIQLLDYGEKYLNNGKVIKGLVAGAFYLHEEDYKGPQGKNHWRGVVWKNNVKNGNYDLEVLRMDTLLKTWGNK